MSNYALIKNGVVENVIVANEKHINKIKNNFDEVIKVGDGDAPNVSVQSGTKYENGEFAAQELKAVEASGSSVTEKLRNVNLDNMLLDSDTKALLADLIKAVTG